MGFKSGKIFTPAHQKDPVGNQTHPNAALGSIQNTRWKSKCVQHGLNSAEGIWKNGLISGDL
jgi:hypothetical protein